MSAAASPWKTAPAGQSATSLADGGCSLADIMSEQLAVELQAQQLGSVQCANISYEEEAVSNEEYPSHDDASTATDVAAGGPTTGSDEFECTDDYLLASMLQREFDKEHDDQLRLREQQYNGNDKVRVTLGNYYLRTTHPADESSDSSDDDLKEDIRQRDLDSKYSVDVVRFGPSGMKKKADGSILTKHDQQVNGKRNVSKVLHFPPDFPTGDVMAGGSGATGVTLSNRIYNDLKTHSKQDEKRHHRIKDPKSEKATAEHGVDASTRLVVFKMIEAELLDSVSGSIATGKESIVFHAFGGRTTSEEGCRAVPNECAVKVYKTTLNQFKNRCAYVRDDYRFNNPRKVLRVWAEKEMLNLNRMRRAGIRCPDVVKLKKHVLVMSFVGVDSRPAPKLKDAPLTDTQLAVAYADCVKTMTRMYEHCRLVHADLSEFNVLWWEEKCWFIDVAQAVDTSHPSALIFLARDCRNIRDFFTRRGYDTETSARQLFVSITGVNVEALNEDDSDEDLMAEVERYCAENRSVERHEDKAKPADANLRKLHEERSYYWDEREEGANPCTPYE